MKRLGFIATLLLSLVLSAAGAKNSVTYDITSMVKNSEVTLMGGKAIRVPTPEGAKVYFEDLKPAANWGHPAKIRVLDKMRKVLFELEVKQPPVGLSRRTPVASGRNNLPPQEGVEFKIKDLDGKHRVKDPENYYAILINGSADQRHWNDTSFLYRVLTQIYGYKKENIWVADSNFHSTDLDGDGTIDVNYLTTMQAIRDLMAMVKTKVNEKGQLLIATNDHGDTVDGESTLVLQDDSMKASEFTALLRDIPAGKVLSIHEPCFSGGFVRGSTSEGRVAMASASDREYSWASMDLNFDEFIYHVITAFAMQTYDGIAVNSDTNKDGSVSAQEAYAYALIHERRDESPMLESAPNSGDAYRLGLGFVNPYSP